MTTVMPRVHQISPRCWWCRGCNRKFSSRAAAARHLSYTGCLDEQRMRDAGLAPRGRYGHWMLTRTEDR